MTSPLRFATGGVLPKCCPDVLSADELKNLDPSTTSPAEAAAAKIKAEEANAKARIAAVRYLATVDCHWWHEAEKALIASLRADKNECVRYAAAIALGTGCCCTEKTIKALNITVIGSNEDGNPSENSERVKHAAWYALQVCMSRQACFANFAFEPVESLEPPEQPPVPRQLTPVPPEQAPPLSPETGPPPRTLPTTARRAFDVEQARFYNKLRPKPVDQSLASARLYASTISAPKPPTKTIPTGGRNLMEIFNRAATPNPVPELPTETQPQQPQRPIFRLPTIFGSRRSPAPLTPIGTIPTKRNAEPRRTVEPAVLGFRAK